MHESNQKRSQIKSQSNTIYHSDETVSPNANKMCFEYVFHVISELNAGFFMFALEFCVSLFECVEHLEIRHLRSQLCALFLCTFHQQVATIHKKYIF